MNVVTVSNLYPSSARPGHGMFVEQRMLRYSARFGAHLRVLAPVPWFPLRRGFGAYSAFARTPLEEERKGVCVRHPRVWILPKIGMHLAPGAWVRACAPELERMHREKNIDLLDAHYLYPDAVAVAELSKKMSIPFVMSARGSDVNVLGELPGPRARIVAAAARAGAVIAVSSALRDKLEAMGVAKDKLHVISNGVDVDRFSPVGRTAASEPGRTLLGVGRLVRGKGFHVAVEALARIAADFPDVSLALAGDGPERAALETLARERGVAGRVRFLGEVAHADIPALLWKSHRFLLPSFHEGYPNVVIEAIAAGVPVVATAVGGIPEIVDAAVGDLAARADDAGALERALRTSLARTFDAAEFARRRENLRWEPILDRLHAVLSAAARRAA